MKSVATAKRRRTPTGPTKTVVERHDALWEAGDDWVAELTEEEQLRWVIESFQREDLDRLSADALDELGYKLRQTVPVGWSFESEKAPLGLRALQSIQAQIRIGLQAFLTDTRTVGAILADAESGWVLPPAEKERLVRISPVGSKETLFLADSRGDETTVLVRGIADLSRRFGQRLRACAECGRSFVATRRQTFCQPSCGQKVRDRRKAERAAQGKQVPARKKKRN